MRGTIGLAMLMAAAPLGAQAPTAEAPCVLPLVAPAPWRGWDRPAPLVAAVSPDVRSAVPLPLARAATVTLAPSRLVRFAAVPAKPAGPVSYAGMLTVQVPVAGIYRVAISAAAWIDMVGGGRTVASVAHAHGPACSGIAKMVDFALPAGTTILEVSGAPTPVTTAMVVRVS